MKISDMNLQEVTARAAEIRAECETASGEALEALRSEVAELEDRKTELEGIQQRTATAEALNNGTAEGKIIEARKDMKPMEEKKIYTRESPEYRDAFYAMIAGTDTAEQRAVLASPVSVDGDATNDGASVAIPKSLDTKIWDNIHTAHPIVADVSTVPSGVVMEVTRHTANTNPAASKKDGATNANGDAKPTFVKVTLSGKDFESYVELTYAEAKMSQGALEDYLAQEIAADIGEALAKDIMAQILADAGAGQKVTPASSPDLFEDLKKALALAVHGGQKSIYAPADKYYEIVGAIKQGSPFNMAATLGVAVKLETAATKVTVLDPKMFVLNEVQATMVESQKDIKAHRVVVSGYMRAQGTLRNTKAAAYIN